MAAPNRVTGIVDAALTVFGRDGFTRVQMADVAAEAGVSVGTLYNYVESKDALLLLCAVYAFEPEEVLEAALPLTVGSRKAFLTKLERHVSLLARIPALDAALAVKSAPVDVSTECAAIVTELFDLIVRTRRGMDALERSARDVPDIGKLFYGGVRYRLLEQFALYLARRAKQRSIPPLTDPVVTARFAVESVTWMARHRHGDPDGGQLNGDDVRTTTIELVTRAICG